MLCSSCGATNPDSATFCSLCLKPFPGSSPLRSGARPAARLGGVGAVAAVPHPAMIAMNSAEHEWWMRRRAEHVEAMATGIPTPGSTYALVAFDGQIRYTRALWWSASVYTLFAWLAALRVANVDWGAVGLGSPVGSAAMLQAVLIGVVGIAAACACAAFVSGPEAWRATLVNTVLWSIPAVFLAVVAVAGGVNGVTVISVLAIGIALITAVVPLSQGRPGAYVPRA